MSATRTPLRRRLQSSCVCHPAVQLFFTVVLLRCYALRYQSHLFQDPRALISVQRMWAKKVQDGLCRDLCMWSLFVLLVLVTAVMATGRNSHYVRSFQVGFEEAILFDECV